MKSSADKGRRFRMVTGLFMNLHSAANAYQSILERGYGKSDVSFIMSGATHMEYFLPWHSMEEKPDSKPKRAPQDEVSSIFFDALTAGATALYLSAEDIVISGPIASTVASRAENWRPRNLTNLLSMLTPSGNEISDYESGIAKGGILMGIEPKTKDDQTRFQTEWCEKNDAGPANRKSSEQAVDRSIDLGHIGRHS